MIFFDFVSKKRIVNFNAFIISIDEINVYQMHIVNFNAFIISIVEINVYQMH